MARPRWYWMNDTTLLSEARFKPAVLAANGLGLATRDEATGRLVTLTVEHPVARQIAAVPPLLDLVDHVLALADDAYLAGHPEWDALVAEARAAHVAAGGGR